MVDNMQMLRFKKLSVANKDVFCLSNDLWNYFIWACAFALFIDS